MLQLKVTSQDSLVRVSSYKFIGKDTTELCFTKASWLVIRDSLYEGSVARHRVKLLDIKSQLLLENAKDMKIEIDGWRDNASICLKEKSVLKAKGVEADAHILTLQGDKGKLQKWLAGSVIGNVLLIVILAIL